MAQLHLNELGMIPASYPKTFYSVTHWKTGRIIADFTSKAECIKVAYVTFTGERMDHKISEMHIG